MKKLVLAALAALAAVSSFVQIECGEHDRYEIVMFVQNDAIVREITAAREDGVTTMPATGPGEVAVPATWPSTQPSSDIDKIAAAYGQKLTDTTFRGLFVGQTPDDVGNYGRLGYYPSPFGSTWFYIERFRGTTDPAGELQERMEKVATLADLIAGYMEDRYGKDADFEPLGKYLHGDFKKDLRNISLYLWLIAYLDINPDRIASGDAPADGPMKLGIPDRHVAILAAAVQYLIEQNWIDVQDAPQIVRLSCWGPDSWTAGERLLRNFLVRRAGLKKGHLLDELSALPEKAGVLMDDFNRYCEDSPQYGDYFKKWAATTAPAARTAPAGGQEATTESQPSSPTVGDFLGNLVNAFGSGPIFGGDVSNPLTVRLRTGVAPLLTNGEWNPQTKEIRWQCDLTGRGSKPVRPPDVFWAVWTQPDEKVQKKHFGKVEFDGKKLAAYCLWRNSLTKDEAAKWEAFESRLRPEDMKKSWRELNPPRIGTTTQPTDKDYADFLGKLLEESETQPAQEAPKPRQP